MTFQQYIVIGLVLYFLGFIYYIDLSNKSLILNLKGIEFLNFYGYEGEEHLVVSEDGFRTKIHRIGHQRQVNKVIVIVPGGHCSSEISFALGPEYDLSYAFYEAGMDVWLVNYRGTYNTEPLENKTFTDDDLTNFSFQEQAYDLEAAINYIRAITGHDKITVASISLGSTIVLSLLAEKPEVSNKVDKAILFAPVGPFTIFSRYFQIGVRTVVTANKALADYLATSFKYRETIAHILCTHPMVPWSCWKFIDYYFGFETGGLNDSLSAVALAKMFTGPYTGVYAHVRQMNAADQFVKRDFGKEKNLRVYNSMKPPLYNMSNIQVPIVIFDAVEDKIATPEAREKMIYMIPNIKKIVKVYPPFQHGNFVANSVFDKKFVNDAIQVVNEDL